MDKIEKILKIVSEGSSYKKIGGKFLFEEFEAAIYSEDFLNNLKELVKKRVPWMFPLLVSYISPVFSSYSIKEYLRGLHCSNKIVLNLGSGTTHFDDVIAIDGSNYENVDIVADLEKLPIKDNSVDAVLSFGVLEHVENPKAHVSEFARILKSGGKVVCFVPFMQPFHASPYDFQRYTDKGLIKLFEDFHVSNVRVGSGPTSSLVWVLQEWLAMVLSLGSKRLYKILVPLMWVLSPLKILDVLLAKHPCASVSASGFLIECEIKK